MITVYYTAGAVWFCIAFIMTYICIKERSWQVNGKGGVFSFCFDIFLYLIWPVCVTIMLIYSLFSYRKK